MFEGQIAKRLGGGMFPEEDMLKCVHTHAAIAAFVSVLPLPVFEQIVFFCVLWHMYSKLASKVGHQMGCGTIIVGVATNLVIYLIYSLALEFIPVLGYLTTAAICYIQFYFSGKVYIETLRSIK